MAKSAILFLLVAFMGGSLPAHAQTDETFTDRVYLKNGDFISKHVLRHNVETRVPVGSYRIKANFDGETIEKRVDVAEDQNNKHVFEFAGK